MQVELRLSEVMAALSHALDISDGHPEGHATRTCLIGMRIADELDLEPADRSALFYGLLLKDLGCSSNAARLASLYGADDHVAKRNAKRIDQTRVTEALAYIVRNSGGIRDLLRVLAAGAKTMREVTETRCERGAEIARMLDLPEETAQTIYSIDEHWDGKGHPHGLAGEEIPILARVACLAQTTEVFLREDGPTPRSRWPRSGAAAGSTLGSSGSCAQSGTTVSSGPWSRAGTPAPESPPSSLTTARSSPTRRGSTAWPRRSRG